jgi:hypothetical protein
MHGKKSFLPRCGSATLLAGLALLGTISTVHGQSRVFMAQPGDEGMVPTTGAYTINVNPGDTIDLEVFIADTAPALMGGYQIAFPGSATLVGGSGTITYVDTAMGSVAVDEARMDWAYFGIIGVSVFLSETGLPDGFAIIGLAPFGTGAAVSGIAYAGEFQLTVSNDASGTFTFPLLPGGAPPNGGTALSDETGVGQIVAELQSLIIKVGPPPANDDCGSAEVAGEGDTPFNTGTASTSAPNDGFGGPGNATCSDNGDDTIENDVWFEHTATCDGPITISTCDQAGFDTRLEVYSGCGVCPPATLAACNDDGAGCSGGTSEVTLAATAGACYTIRVGGLDEVSLGTGTLSITSGSCFIDSTCHGDGTVNPGNECEVCDASASTTDWTASAAGTSCTDDGNECTLDECDGAGACAHPGTSAGTPCTDDGEICTLDECDGAGICGHPPAASGLACPDDGNACTLDECDGAGACGHPPASGGTPCDDGLACTGTGAPGIDDDQCDGAGGCVGEFDPNCSDNCVDAAEALEGTNPGNNTGFGTSQQVSCAFNSTNDAWFVHTANCTGTLRFTTIGSSFDTVLTLFDDCGGAELACDDDGGPGLTSATDLAVTAGEDYFIRIAGFNGAQGPISLNITRIDTCLIDATCHADATVNPGNECEHCIAILDSTAWSPQPRGLACGNPVPDDVQCDSPDACDGLGSCDANHKPQGSSCGDASDTECDNPDTCDGLGLCGDNFETSGFACGDASDTECDNPDICDGGGGCTPNFETTGSACGSAFDDDCDNPDSCDGGGGCLDNLELSGTSCGDSSDTECTDPDTCDGIGVCEPNNSDDFIACNFMGGGPLSGLCEAGECIPACDTAADCADGNDDNIIDDACIWYECTETGCNEVDRVFADVGGAFGECPPDGFANVHDQNHVLSCFELTNTCALINIDAGGPFGACEPDGFCNVHDVNHVLQAFDNTTTCACPLDGGPAPEMPVFDVAVVGQASFRAQADRQVAQPGERVTVQVMLDGTVDLQSYQLEAGVRRLQGIGWPELVEIRIDNRQDHVFEGVTGTFEGFNQMSGQMLKGMAAGSSATLNREYLATFVYQIPKRAHGRFEIGVLNSGHTFLVGEGGRIEITETTPVTIEVQALRRWQPIARN